MIHLFWRVGLVLAVLIPGGALGGGNYEVVHLINNVGSNALTTLNLGSKFVTSFKGTNDVTITPVTGVLNSIYAEDFSGAHAAFNPGYAVNFVGSTNFNTGNGSVGLMKTFETQMGAVTNQFRFDFAQPLTPLDHLLVWDVENSEQYIIQAYVLRNGSYQQVGLTNWVPQNFSGGTGIVPDSTWATWNATNGALTSAISVGATEPLVVLTPDQPIDRVVFIKVAVGVGSASFQFLAEPGSLASLQLNQQKTGTNAVISWPNAFSGYKLYRTGTLGLGANWTLITNAPVTVGYSLFVTNPISTNAFYRLQNQ